MGSALRFAVLVLVKGLSRLFYAVELTWVGGRPAQPYGDVRLAMLLNHTSLFEPIFLGVVPLPVLWRIARHGAFPGADITMNRPLAGTFYRLLAPNVTAITRQRDHTWKAFMASLTPESVILIAPEGRMKRPTGLDKDGMPMTVRGGVADLLRWLDAGQMIIAYSGGLHHIHAPGQRLPRLFKRAQLCLEQIEIRSYKSAIGVPPEDKRFARALVTDLEARRNRHCA